MRLATLEQAKEHLRITDPILDGEVAAFLELASAQVYDYIGAPRADPAWDEVTAPPVVRAATLKVVVHNWQHRGDESDESALWSAIRELLRRTRDPAFA